ncbi:MAG: hypothetical protein HFJ54_04790 [Clostridia bacterium]|nr:hypothetical protein [Clostridia bacterium]
MEEEILKKLDTKFIGRNLIVLEEIDSTQKYAKSIAEKAENGTIVIAKSQTVGIGTNRKKLVY